MSACCPPGMIAPNTPLKLTTKSCSIGGNKGTGCPPTTVDVPVSGEGWSCKDGPMGLALDITCSGNGTYAFNDSVTISNYRSVIPLGRPAVAPAAGSGDPRRTWETRAELGRPAANLETRAERDAEHRRARGHSHLLNGPAGRRPGLRVKPEDTFAPSFPRRRRWPPRCARRTL